MAIVLVRYRYRYGTFVAWYKLILLTATRYSIPYSLQADHT